MERKDGEEEIFLSSLNLSSAAPPCRGGRHTSNTTFKDVV